jgi:heme oxygenase (biliverdin-IX-beta and delta-forming)
MNIVVETEGRRHRLKAATNATHERLDARIMASGAFSSRERYGQFVLVQHGFHRDIDALYSNAALDGLLPDLAGRRRFGQICQDLDDLGLHAPAADAPPAFTGTDADLSTALGWLYVAEGSNLGAAFLLVAAERLGFSETFGARHLAPAPGGRGLHWRTFTAALDAVDLSAEEEHRVVAGADAAFARVRALVGELLALSAEDSHEEAKQAV